jgi:hypothetical protein
MTLRTVLFSSCLLLAPASGTMGAEPGGVVTGTVLVEGEVPAPKRHALDGEMRRHTSEPTYADETWLVGPGRGLANCVLTLTAKAPADRPRPLTGAVLAKVGVRFVPRVLVVTAGTEVTLRNRESPCLGFYLTGHPLRGNHFNYLIPKGKEEKVTLKGPDVAPVSCPARPFTRGYVHVVDTPHYAVTDARGAYAIAGVPAGTYRVAFWHEGAGKLPQKGTAPTELTITEGEPHTRNFKVALSPDVLPQVQCLDGAPAGGTPPVPR